MTALGIHPAAAAGGGARPGRRVRQPAVRALLRVAWRQHRRGLLIVGLLAAGLSAWLLATVSDSPFGSGPQPQWALAMPLAVAVFIAAPLIARGYETGSLRFALTQGVRRGRWAASQLCVVAAAGAVVAVLPALAGAWWLAHPAATWTAPWRWDRIAFNVTPVMVPCWTLLGISAGALAAVLLRRSVPAMAATLGSFAVVAYLMDRLRVPPAALLGIGARAIRLDRPLQVTCSSSCQVISPAGQQQADGHGIVLAGWFTHAGHRLTGPQAAQLMARVPEKVVNSASPYAFSQWLSARHYAYWLSYQPDSRFWAIQAMQGALLVILAAALAGLAVWLLRRRPV